MDRRSDNASAQDDRPADLQEDLCHEAERFLQALKKGLEAEAPDADFSWLQDDDSESSFSRLPQESLQLDRLGRALSCRLRALRIARTAEAVRADLPRSPLEAWIAAVDGALEAGAPPDGLRRDLEQLLFEPVFTPDSVEASNAALWQIQTDLLSLWAALPGDPNRNPEASESDRLEELATALIAADSPAPTRSKIRDERNQVLFFLARSLFPAVPLLADLRRAALERVAEDGTDIADIDADRPVLRCLSRVGGDMDGNPQVTADTLQSSLKTHREEILDLYIASLKRLAERLGPAERDSLEGICARLERSELVSEPPDEAYGSSAELIRDLVALQDRCGERNADIAAGLAALMLQVQVFGFHLAAVEQRQDSARHREAMAHLLLDDRWLERPAAGRTRRLRQLLPRTRARRAPPGSPATVHQTLAVFRALLNARRQGVEPEAFGPFVVSMTEGPDDLLTVLWLARRAGLVDEDSGQVPLDIVPLFETFDDLDGAPGILRELCNMPLYQNHLASRDDRQWVMFGYGDANRDAGMVASRWAMRRCRRRFFELQDELPRVQILVSHGQVSGGRARRSVRAASAAGTSPRLRLAVSGERLLPEYGLPVAAAHAANRALVSTLGDCAPMGGDRVDEADAVTETLVHHARQAYRDLVFGERKLYRYFRLATPVDAIERLIVTSRPARRRSQIGVSGLRAKPWILAWTQSRHALPGWYGLGSGLEEAVRRHGLDAVRHGVLSSPFLGRLIDDARGSLAAASMGTARRYADLAADLGRQVFPHIQSEHARTLDWLAELGETGSAPPPGSPLADLHRRDVEKMSELQIELLTRWRTGGRDDDTLLQALLRTVHGLAKSLENFS